MVRSSQTFQVSEVIKSIHLHEGKKRLILAPVDVPICCETREDLPYHLWCNPTCQHGQAMRHWDHPLPRWALPALALPAWALLGWALLGWAPPALALPGWALLGWAPPALALPGWALLGWAPPALALPGGTLPALAVPDLGWALPRWVCLGWVLHTRTLRRWVEGEEAGGNIVEVTICQLHPR